MRRRSRASSSGFTLIEMIVVVTVLAMLTAIILPSLVRMKSSDDYKTFLSGVRRIASEARERAISSGRTTQVTYDESTHELHIEEIGDDGNGNAVSTVAVDSTAEPQRWQLEGKDSSASEFKLQFTPDGHSNGGGIEFPNFSLIVDKSGQSRFLDGQLPDPEDERWQAGDLEKRQ
jgi:prepilin-type N-terminal cleavage/methylation domain-containing protein